MDYREWEERQRVAWEARAKALAEGNGPACNPWTDASPDEIAAEFEDAQEAQDAHAGDDGYDDDGETP